MLQRMTSGVKIKKKVRRTSKKSKKKNRNFGKIKSRTSKKRSILIPIIIGSVALGIGAIGAGLYLHSNRSKSTKAIPLIKTSPPQEIIKLPPSLQEIEELNKLVFGGYEVNNIEDFLKDKKAFASGSFGRVYNYDKDKVIKVIKTETQTLETQSPAGVIKEVTNLKYTSGNISPKFYGFCYDNDTYYLIMEKYDGSTSSYFNEMKNDNQNDGSGDDDQKMKIPSAAKERIKNGYVKIKELIKKAIYEYKIYCYDVKSCNIVYKKIGEDVKFAMIDTDACNIKRSIFESVATKYQQNIDDIHFLLNFLIFLTSEGLYYKEYLDNYFYSKYRLYIFYVDIIEEIFEEDVVLKKFMKNDITSNIIVDMCRIDGITHNYVSKQRFHFEEYFPKILNISPISLKGVRHPLASI